MTEPSPIRLNPQTVIDSVVSIACLRIGVHSANYLAGVAASGGAWSAPVYGVDARTGIARVALIDLTALADHIAAGPRQAEGHS